MKIEKRKCLVTGADGFIGSHLTEMLLNKGCKVKALSYYNSFNNWGWLEDIRHSDLEIVTGDIRDAYFCRELLKGTEIVFHLAALIAIPYSYVAPGSYIETNVNGTYNICKAAMEEGVKHIIHTSTSEVYGTALYVPIDENHPFQPQSPYIASKIGADAIAMSFYHSFGLPLTIARPFNTYGPRQSARAVIPTIITQIADGKKEIKLGDLSPTRDFNYVLDTCHGLVLLAESDQSIGQTVNIGSNTEISIADTLDLIKRIMNAEVKFTADKSRIRPSGSEVTRLCCDNTKIRALTGYKPSYDFEKGLHETIKWFTSRNNLKHYKSQIYNR